MFVLMEAILLSWVVWPAPIPNAGSVTPRSAVFASKDTFLCLTNAKAVLQTVFNVPIVINALNALMAIS